MEWVLIWLAFGIVAMIVASGKNRSGCGWFILGCLFGPFALVVAALPKLTDAGKSVEDVSDLRKCPFCAEMIKKEAIKCRFCGSDVPPDKPARSFGEQLGYDTARAFRQGKDSGNSKL